jgi:hypothetical protein
VVLVEGDRCRAVPAGVADALVRTLGRPQGRASAPGASGDGASGIELVEHAELASLAASLPAGSSVLVAASARGPDRAGSSLCRLDLREGVQGGMRVLDRLTIAWLRGATHLCVPAGEHGWWTRSPNLADHLARLGTIVAAGPAGAVWELPPVPAPGPPKVFGIGLNKTGTTSLHQACELLGLRSFHWGDRAAFEGVLDAVRTGRRLLEPVDEGYDVYSDIETLAVRFDVADLQYPGSRFVLTVRDVEGWIDSRRRHVERNRRRRESGAYDGVNLRVDEEQWRRQWHTHVERVTKYFDGRDDLLVLDITAGHGWERLAPFLGFAVPSVPFPHGNADRRAGAAATRREPGAGRDDSFALARLRRRVAGRFHALRHWRDR